MSIVNRIGAALGAATMLTMLTGQSFAASTHVVTALSPHKWQYKPIDAARPVSTSTNTTPVLVDDIVVGDTIEIDIPDASGSHGFMTGTVAAPAPELVLPCGQTDEPTPRPLHEVCANGASTQFGNDPFTGKMQLTVMPAFTTDIDFFCVIHLNTMTGKLKLKP